MILSGHPLRIAILTHSTNPRGGVVHAIELADALARMGHEAVVHAPDPSGQGFFRAPLTPARTVIATPSGSHIAQMVEARIADYVRHFEISAHRGFDVFHAQDSISGNALATLKERGLITKFVRTVHHVDQFTDPRLQAWQERAIVSADELLVVSRTWQQALRETFDREAVVVRNGVDTLRFTSSRTAMDAEIRRRYGIDGAPVLLSVGGVEERKNSVRALQAFQQLLAIRPDAQFVIAGGASLLDHQRYQHEFDAIVDSDPMLKRAVLRLGPVSDEAIQSLYRLADALLFPSLKEGFGLAVLEAMASGTPVVTSRIAPFTEYLDGDDVVWCDPLNVASIANAAMTAISEPLRTRLKRRGTLIARQHDWGFTAAAHLPTYQQIVAYQHA